MLVKELKKYILAVVDVVVQLKRGSGGKRYVSEVYFKGMRGNDGV